MKKLPALLLGAVLIMALIGPARAESTLPPAAEVGGTVLFGHYMQDGDPSAGLEPIEWIVLDIRDGKALLLSRYGLDAKPYHTSYKNVTWEKCALREWLNGEFMDQAFSADEKQAIVTTHVDNGESQCWSGWYTNVEYNTEDNVFLLSCAEAGRYLGVAVDGHTNIRPRAAVTAFALGNGAFASGRCRTSEGEAAGWWWLRSHGYDQYSKALVDSDGSLDSGSVDDFSVAVRPAVWVSLEASGH